MNVDRPAGTQPESPNVSVLLAELLGALEHVPFQGEKVPQKRQRKPRAGRKVLGVSGRSQPPRDEQDDGKDDEVRKHGA